MLNKIVTETQSVVKALNELYQFENLDIDFEIKVERWFRHFFNNTSFVELLLIDCYNRKSEHPRYLNYISEFEKMVEMTYREQSCILNEFITNCENLKLGKTTSNEFIKEDGKDIFFDFNLEDYTFNKNIVECNQDEINYSDVSHSMGKIYDSLHPNWNFEYNNLKGFFSSNKIITDELNYLRDNSNNENEYGISMMYLRILIENSRNE